MPLAPGARLGAYEIVHPLGAGGMGEVYKARDTRLDRTVAIKVVTTSLAGDADLRLRFEHEARAIAALNHPHICTIHDVGRDGNVDFLVMELLDGEALAGRMKRSPLPIGEALAIAIQIGDALDAAHRAGIVHRDLKPGNVMLVRSSGQGGPIAKLLDFGLAASAPTKAHGLEASLLATVAPSTVATKPPGLTSPLGFSGTVQYMAPEQMEGHAVDHRADVFAFGCVLYEMLAGRKAFEGATSVAVIASVIGTEPPPIETLRSAPPSLDHLVRRCLEKSPGRRWQHMGDVTGELRWIASQPIAAPIMPLARGLAVWQRVALALGVVVIVPLALLAGVRILREPPIAVPSVLEFEIATPPTDAPSLALSPDGRQLVFVANQNRRPMLWLRTLDRVANRPLPGTEGASLPFWSPDGQSIGFFADGKLKRIDVASGALLVIADAPNGRGGTWGPDGTILFAPGVDSPIVRVASGGGPVASVTKTEGRTGHRQPQFLPGGKRFLYNVTLGTPETDGIYIGSLESGPPVRVVAANSLGVFAPPDRLLTLRQGALVAFTFDPDTRTVEGEPMVIAQGIARGGAVTSFSTSATGVLAYWPGDSQRRQLVWVNRQGLVLSSVGEAGSDSVGAPELSPDERAIALFLQPRGDNEIGVIDLVRNLPRLITNGPPADAHPIWDPDGRHVVYVSARVPGGGPVRQAVDGTGLSAALFPTPTPGGALSWTRDRRFVLLRRAGVDGRPDLVAVSVDGARTMPIAQSSFDETEGQFSPDGSWVAFVSNEMGRAEVYLQAFPESGARTQVSTAGGTQVRWSADGKEIFYVAPDGKMMAVAIAFRGGAPAPAPPVPLFQTFLATGTNVVGNKAQYAVARDGRFLLNTVVEAPSAPIVVSMDWRRGLGREQR